MTPILTYTLTGIFLFGLGLGGLFIGSHPFRKILAMNIAGSGLFLVLVALARRPLHASADRVPDALVLTGIVVAVSATAVALALYRRLETFVEVADETASQPAVSDDVFREDPISADAVRPEPPDH